jgi:hypothetical protein
LKEPLLQQTNEEPEPGTHYNKGALANKKAEQKASQEKKVAAKEHPEEPKSTGCGCSIF